MVPIFNGSWKETLLIRRLDYRYYDYDYDNYWADSKTDYAQVATY